MLSANKNPLSFATALIFLTTALSAAVFAQTEEMKVADDVEALQKLLTSASFEERDAVKDFAIGRKEPEKRVLSDQKTERQFD